MIVFVNLTLLKVKWEEETITEEWPLSDGPICSTFSLFQSTAGKYNTLYAILPWAAGPELYKKGPEQASASRLTNSLCL